MRCKSRVHPGFFVFSGYNARMAIVLFTDFGSVDIYVGQVKAVLQRLARFVAFYPQTLGHLNRRLEYVDLRYPNGFALRVPEIMHPATEPNKVKPKRGSRGASA